MAMPRRPRSSKSQVGTAEFKARCFELIDHVKEARAEYIVTRHGKPVAKLGPVEALSSVSPLGAMRGTLLKYDDPFDPIPATWATDRDDDA
jgi:prevent-host-death family protein